MVEYAGEELNIEMKWEAVCIDVHHATELIKLHANIFHLQLKKIIV